jgi:dephospho-CoA kinase
MIIVGLTGSIGMGKTTIARMFHALGIAIWNADEVVHRLYSGGPLVTQIAAAFDGVVTKAGAVNRKKLSQVVLKNKEKLSQLQSLVHPLVAADRQQFIANAREKRAPYVILDIPLLFETNSQKAMDKIIVVSCNSEIQRQRVLARQDMTEEKFKQILANQLPSETKAKHADFVIDTSGSLADSEKQVRLLHKKLLGLKS